MRSQPVEKVVIVGGGSAGWLTAALVAAAHQTPAGPALKVTLIESPEVAPVGVGEGTWLSMRETLLRIGVSESDFFRACDASFKQGSLFVGWVDGGDDDAYYHPFELPYGYGETHLAASWQRQHGAMPFADLVSVQPHLCRAGRAPKQAATPEFAAVANYGYHLDAAKFGLFLRRHCTEKLGVIHVPDHVVAVHAHADGDIASVQTALGGGIDSHVPERVARALAHAAAVALRPASDRRAVSRRQLLIRDVRHGAGAAGGPAYPPRRARRTGRRLLPPGGRNDPQDAGGAARQPRTDRAYRASRNANQVVNDI
nr:tryptophan 7-halogenase [Massilia sp. JS1662]